MNTVSDFLLQNLILENFDSIADAPIKTARSGKHHQITIGIGRDHTANLCLTDEAYKELMGVYYKDEDCPRKVTK